MTTPSPESRSATPPPEDASVLIAARREKLRKWREELGVDPYGRRVEGLISLAQARAQFDQTSHEAFKSASEAARADPGAKIDDHRPRVIVAGRCIQHRAMGKLVFIVLRDFSGDLQISVSKSAVSEQAFKVASKLDYGDIVVAGGAIGMTNNGEICVWADRFEVHAKSLVPPPEKFHGLQDDEIRYRQRYVDMYANPSTMQTMLDRSRILSSMRRFMEARGFVEVETPMMQPLAGGAAARPFITHHNALDIDLYMRIAPELYLKRLLVGGMPRVFEINRNFRNEGIDRSHNPEFTMMEAYEAFGDCWTMLELTESLIHQLAVENHRDAGSDDQREEDPGHVQVAYGDLTIDCSRPFARRKYGDLFLERFGFDMTDRDKTLAKAIESRVENAAKLDHWLLVSALFDAHCESLIDPAKPTFVTDFPSAISPLTRPQPDAPAGGGPHLSYRWELFIAGMEFANSYTELNDPDVQLAKFTEQLRGADEEAAAFRTLDEDFIHALRVGMPPAGGLGLGVDRLVMLLCDKQSIRDVVLFPLMRPENAGPPADAAHDKGNA